MNYLRQGTATTVPIGPFLDKTDGVTEEIALAPTVLLNKNGAGYAAASDGTTAHDTNGWYDCDLDVNDVDTPGRLEIISQDSATHLPVWHEFVVLTANAYDALVLGTDSLQVHVTEISAAILADIADAVWDELLAGHLGAGSAGEALYNATLALLGAAERNYPVIEPDMVTPIPDASVWISTDIAGSNVIWFGVSDAFGIARRNGQKPFLSAGTYYFWVYKTGYTFPIPDTEVFV